MSKDVLRLGDKGADVKELHRGLFDKGFSPGNIDGQFGGGTSAAVVAFQNSEGLLADGVAGLRTQAVLGLTASSELADVTSSVTVQVVSQMCPFTPIGNIKANLPVVLDSLSSFGLFHQTMVLLAIATIRAETESFMPISEGQSGLNTSPSGHPFYLYDNRRDLGNNGPFDGQRYKGREFIQLTGGSKYGKYGPGLNPVVDLETNPDLANASTIAADQLSTFLNDRELQIKDALMHGNMQAARRLVNGGVNGLDRFSEAYKIGDSLPPATV